MARLLAAERQVAAQHLLHHVLVADRAADHADAGLLQRNLQTDVAHHGGDDRVALQPPLGLHPHRAHQHDGVAVHDLAGRVDEDRAVAVAVEGDAKRVTAPRRPVFASGSGAVEPQPRLMFRPSGWLPMWLTSKPRSSNSRGATVVVAPLAQSIGDAHAGGARVGRQDLAQVRHVLGAEIDLLDRAGFAVAHRP